MTMHEVNLVQHGTHVYHPSS